jgi:exodeoxyribonuclease VII large subunit
MAAYDYYGALSNVKLLTDLLHKSAAEVLNKKKNSLSVLLKNKFFRKPLDVIYERQTHLESLTRALYRLLSDRLNKERTRINYDTDLLNKVSPETIWKRGFAVVRGESGKVVQAVAELGVGEKVRLQFSDGQAVAEIKGKMI